jgi:ferric-dicitrate binding protein FerR (iron transport regulator)
MTFLQIRQLAAAVCLFVCPSVVAAQEVGTVASLNGTAELGSEGNWRSVAISSPVYLGDTLRTGQPGRVRIVFQDDSVLNVGDGSDVIVDEQVFDPEGGSYRTALRLLRGKLRALVSEYYSSPSGAYEVETPTAVAGVRCTEFVLTYDVVRQQTEVVGVTGRVAVNGLGGRAAEEVFITAGDVTTVAKGQRPTAPQRIGEDRFRQHIEGISFIGQGRAESLTANHAVVAGVDVPSADRAPLMNAGMDGRGERDASTLLEQPPQLIEQLQGGLSIRF